MESSRKEAWLRAYNGLELSLRNMGYQKEFAYMIARSIGSEKGIRRMTAYLHNAKPRSMEEIVDEMLAISDEISSWRKKKEAEEANESYTEYLNSEFREDEED